MYETVYVCMDGWMYVCMHHVPMRASTLTQHDLLEHYGPASQTCEGKLHSTDIRVSQHPAIQMKLHECKETVQHVPHGRATAERT